MLFVDLTFYKGASALLPKLPSLKALVVMTDRANMPGGVTSNVLCYEDMIAGESQEYAWPKLDENIAAALCYTSGTTGNPKVRLLSNSCWSYDIHSDFICAFSVGSSVQPSIDSPPRNVNDVGQLLLPRSIRLSATRGPYVPRECVGHPVLCSNRGFVPTLTFTLCTLPFVFFASPASRQFTLKAACFSHLPC